jgi:hypothetical protein
MKWCGQRRCDDAGSYQLSAISYQLQGIKEAFSFQLSAVSFQLQGIVTVGLFGCFVFIFPLADC